MGIYATCRRVSPERLDAILACQDEQERLNYMYGDLDVLNPEYYWSEKSYGGITERLNYGLPPGAQPILDVVSGGTRICDGSYADSPVRCFTRGEVQEIVAGLTALGWIFWPQPRVVRPEYDPDLYNPDDEGLGAGELEDDWFTDDSHEQASAPDIALVTDLSYDPDLYNPEFEDSDGSDLEDYPFTDDATEPAFEPASEPDVVSATYQSCVDLLRVVRAASVAGDALVFGIV